MKLLLLISRKQMQKSLAHGPVGHGAAGLSRAVTLAAIEVLEGTARQPRWKRRKLKGIYPEGASRA